MAAFRALLVGLALLLCAARLFTGIVYEHGDPTTYFVLKHAPSLAMTQENAAATPIRQRFTVLDGDENELFYQPAYLWLMRASFVLAALCGAAALLLRGSRRHARRR